MDRPCSGAEPQGIASARRIVEGEAVCTIGLRRFLTSPPLQAPPAALHEHWSAQSRGPGPVIFGGLASTPEVPTIELAGLSDAQKRALRIADNKIALGAGWDIDIAAQE